MAAEKDEATKVSAYVGLLVAESEFLQANGWHPYAPTAPGEKVPWKHPRSGALFTQDAAVSIQKSLERR